MIPNCSGSGCRSSSRPRLTRLTTYGYIHAIGVGAISANVFFMLCPAQAAPPDLQTVTFTAALDTPLTLPPPATTPAAQPNPSVCPTALLQPATDCALRLADQSLPALAAPPVDRVDQTKTPLAPAPSTPTSLADVDRGQTGQVEPVRRPAAPPSSKVLKEGSLVLGSPYIRFQGVYLLQGDDSSARARFTGLYPIAPNLLFGAEVDLTTGNAFTDSPGTGVNLNELYVAYSLPNVPNLRFVGGLMDLTSYFDRNSFAKDGTTHFFNPVFQTNPALSAANIASRPGFLVNWNATDNLELKAAAFSANRSLGDFAINSFAGEVGLRLGTAIIRGTYVSTKDNGKRTGFDEIFAIPRRNGEFGFRYGDREEAYGINAEYYIPSLRLGLFGRYGWYNNLSLGRSGDTFNVGVNLLDVFMPSDRLGIGYGKDLSNSDLRRQLNNKIPDVFEVFYDVKVLPNLRAGLTFQERNEFSETIFGFRIKTEFDVVPFRRPFQ